jgi:hypothetical protein
VCIIVLFQQSFLLASVDTTASVVSTTDPVLWLVRLREFGTPSSRANLILAYKFIGSYINKNYRYCLCEYICVTDNIHSCVWRSWWPGILPFRAPEFCMLTPAIYWSSVWNLLQVPLMGPLVVRWLLDF